jgi:hypothetical protein
LIADYPTNDGTFFKLFVELKMAQIIGRKSTVLADIFERFSGVT